LLQPYLPYQVLNIIWGVANLVEYWSWLDSQHPSIGPQQALTWIYCEFATSDSISCASKPTLA
jgi:hypothetical protein